jgi:hypothetical protein
MNELSPMDRKSRQRGVIVKRFPVSFLSDVVYGSETMSTEFAETTLRRDHRVSYENVMWSLCESDPDAGQCYGFGKALTELACLRLNDFDPSWK